MGKTGYACRFYLYPFNYDTPEETSFWYFGTIDRSRVRSLSSSSSPSSPSSPSSLSSIWTKKRLNNLLVVAYLVHRKGSPYINPCYRWSCHQADELLTHKQNGDGAYLVRYSTNKQAFVLSIKVHLIGASHDQPKFWVFLSHFYFTMSYIF